MENLSTQESLKIIQTVIEQRKHKYEENGFFLLFWGVLICIAGIAQYIMITNGYGDVSGYAWLFTMVPGFIFTFIASYVKGKKQKKNHQSLDYTDFVWMVAGILAMATGFLFGDKFGIGFSAMLFIPFCIASITSSLSLKNYTWTILAIISTIIAYGTIFIPFKLHPLMASVISLLLFVIPGVQLYMNYKKRK